MLNSPLRSRKRQSYWVIAAVAAVAFLVAGSGAGLVGPVFAGLISEFRWSNEQTSSLATGYTVGVLVGAPAVGVALDKVGARTTMVVGILMTSVGVLLASYSHSWVMMVTAFTLAGIGFSTSFQLPSAVVVAEWMPQKKNLGMGIIMGSMSVGAATVAPLIGWCSGTYGWRPSLRAIDVVVMLLAPLVWLTVRARPVGASSEQTSARTRASIRVAARDLLSHAFLLIVAGSTFTILALGCVQFHVISMLSQAGYGADFANLAFGGTWLLSALGAYVLGGIADRFGAVRVLSIALVAGALGTLTLLFAADKHIGVACVATFVVLWGGSSNCLSQLMPVILVERFGNEHLGTLVGVALGISGIVCPIAPLVTGLMYDRFGDYRVAIYFSAMAALIASGFIVAANARRPVPLNELSQRNSAAV